MKKNLNWLGAIWLCFGWLGGCVSDSEEALVRQWETADSLRNRIPELRITSPQNGDTVSVPFTVAYEVRNWPISVNGKHVQWFENGENRGLHFGANSLAVPQMGTGRQRLGLELARENFSLTGVSDSVEVFVKPPPPATFPLLVNGGSGSGNYPAGQQVGIAALVPQGQLFAEWRGDVAHIASSTEAATQVRMPARPVALQAVFRFPPLSYAADIRPVLQGRCLSCHNGLYSPNLATCQSLQAQAQRVKAVIQNPNDPMPPTGLMPQADIAKIIQWLDQNSDCL